MDNVSYKVHPKENRYFALSVVASILGYLMIAGLFFSLFSSTATRAGLGILIFYASFFVFYYIFTSGILAGYVRGNGVRITEVQFPEIFEICRTQSRLLGIEMPPVYIMQSGGALNAFATRFIGRNYVVIYSEIFDLAFEQGLDELSFVLAHELGHIRQYHHSKNFWLFPSIIVPFLRQAYSRGCEYTCDNIGHALSPQGSTTGLLILASGKTGYRKVNVNEYVRSAGKESGFWVWFSEKVSSHPYLPKRVQNLS